MGKFTHGVIRMPPALPSLSSRVTLPFSDISGWINHFSTFCSAIVVYEHTGTVTEKVHCHVLWSLPTVTSERLKQVAKSEFGLTLKGNGDWSFKSAYKDRIGVRHQVDYGIITYMSKGSLTPKYVNGISEDVIEVYKNKWVEHTVDRDTNQILYTNWEEDVHEAFYRQHGKDENIPWGIIKDIQGRDYAVDAVNFIRRHAYQEAFATTRYFHTPRTAQLANSLHVTYRMKHGMLTDAELAKILKS